MAQQPMAAGTWDEDPAGASLLLATGRPRHDLLVVAEPALLTELDEAWGRPASTVRLSFLPGVSAPGTPGQEDQLRSYDRDGLGVLVARGRTSLMEGKPARRVTGLARIAAGAGVRAALLVTRAATLADAAPGTFLPVADHLNLTGAPFFPASGMVDTSWDEALALRLGEIDGVGSPAVVALLPGPVRPTRAETAWLASTWAEAVVTDTVAEAAALSSRGVRVAGLALVDSRAGAGAPGGARRPGRRAAAPAADDGETVSVRRPELVVADAIEAVLAALR